MQITKITCTTIKNKNNKLRGEKTKYNIVITYSSTYSAEETIEITSTIQNFLLMIFYNQKPNSISTTQWEIIIQNFLKIDSFSLLDLTNFIINHNNKHHIQHIQKDKPLEYNTLKELFLDNLKLISKINLKQCCNCGRYFSPVRSDTLYCYNISPQDQSKTCQEYSHIRTYQQHLKTNQAMYLYKKIYMKKQMRALRNSDNLQYQKDFITFKDEAKKWKLLLKNNKCTDKDYISWLENQQKA